MAFDDMPNLATPAGLDHLMVLAAVVARRKCWGWTQAERDTFIADAPSLIVEALRSFKSGNSFTPWCIAVLSNEATDRAEAQKGAKERWGKYALSRPVFQPGPLRGISERDEYSAPFSEADLVRIRSWPSDAVRLQLLVEGRCAELVPSPEWRRWCEHCRLRGDLPPHGCRAMSQSQLRKEIAAALDISMNLLDARRKRNWELLENLDRIKSMRGLDGATPGHARRKA